MAAAAAAAGGGTSAAAGTATTAGSASVGPYLAGAGAQVGTGILGYIGAREARKHSTKLMKQAQEHDLSMWQMQAKYNSPQEQMARLKAAGLNPNLIYGQGASGATGNQASRPDTHIQGTQVENELAQLILPNVTEALLAVEQLKQAKQETTRKFYETAAEEVKANQLGFDYYRSRELFDHMTKSGKWYEMLDLKADDQLNRYKRSATELELRTLELELARQLKPLGLSVNDPIYGRLLVMFGDMLGLNIRDRVKNKFGITKEKVRKTKYNIEKNTLLFKNILQDTKVIPKW